MHEYRADGRSTPSEIANVEKRDLRWHMTYEFDLFSPLEGLQGMQTVCGGESTSTQLPTHHAYDKSTAITSTNVHVLSPRIMHLPTKTSRCFLVIHVAPATIIPKHHILTCSTSHKYSKLVPQLSRRSTLLM